jgi:ABC-2 type transport system ATP-binding protein
MLSCSGLTKIYRHRRAVDDFSLELPAGRILGLVGPNGAGKSTLLKMITGLIWPSAGSVSIEGVDVHARPRQALARVGAIIEWPAFYPDLSARLNLDILSGGSGRDYELRRAEVVKMVDMQGFLNEKVGRFSTGMKQRLGIALALLPDSKFIILDEPTNGLDPLGLIEIRRIIREYHRKFGTTILVTTHLLPEIEQVATDIAVIDRGRLIAAGDIQTLLSADNLLVIAVSEPARAAELLNCAAFPIARLRVIEGEGLRMSLADERCIGEINQLLVANGIAVTHLSVERKTLENFFLENTGGDDHVA